MIVKLLLGTALGFCTHRGIRPIMKEVLSGDWFFIGRSVLGVLMGMCMATLLWDDLDYMNGRSKERSFLTYLFSFIAIGAGTVIGYMSDPILDAVE